MATNNQLFIPWREHPLQSLEDRSKVLDPLLRAMLNTRTKDREQLLLKASISSLHRMVRSTSADFAILALPDGHHKLKLRQCVIAEERPTSSPSSERLSGLVSECVEDVCLESLETFVRTLVSDKSSTPLRLWSSKITDLGAIALVGGAGSPTLEEQSIPKILENLLSCFDRICSMAGTGLDGVEKSYVLARLARLKCVRIAEDFHLDPLLLHSLPAERISALKILPIRAEAEGLVVAISDPLNTDALREFELTIGRQVKTKLVVPAADIDRIVKQLESLSYDSGLREQIHQKYGRPNQKPLDTVVESKLAAVGELVNALVARAYFAGASDIHFEPQHEYMAVRFRIDGICRLVDQLPRAVHPELINRLKVMAELDITRHSIPQDGRIEFRRYCPEIDIDLRVAIAPMRYGESVVLRIIDRTIINMSLEKLGFIDKGLETYKSWLARPHGMIIHAGPTGSGKSISLFAALAALKSTQIKIVTAEDPIEYTLEGINQLEIRPKAGLTFASALRSFVRLDPDVILLGEMRDAETAQVAFMAALAGPRLFTTLHASDSLATIPRLQQLGIDTYHIAYSLLGICAQRLLRRLCICKKQSPATDDEKMILRTYKFDDSEPIFRPGACEICDFTGFKGRIGAYELLTCTGEVQHLIASDADLREIQAGAQAAKLCTLREAALAHVIDGITAFEEVARVIGLY
jgi:type IV pilus assembly protein PilB